MTKSTDPAESAQSQFAHYARPLVDEALTRAALVDPNADDFHKLRIALRRLRTLLWAWRPLLGRDAAERERAFLKRAAAAAGEARDWDIAVKLLGAQDEAGESLAGERLEAARREARARAAVTLSAADLKHALREMLHATNRALNTSSQRTPVKRLARERVDDARRALKQRRRRAEKAKRGDYAAWHEVRKGAKKLRYLLEFFGPELKARDIDRLESLKKLQKRFGKLNDAVATEQLLAAHPEVFADSASAETALAALKRERKRRRRAAAKSLH
ncbi:CHAD domain-containing protein [Paraburkholderia acidisoli]|uniref:CHAD domain-containing protein n=1 Tax=Paraburkholderia acidisoli TaxID=2571748 RepID=A0A7Z2GN74_9BURK|nr:CHAD domain-containing protein [Paraburkholderia acidisoli]QGZ64887.1 CHAD domain-containing protein [Paraburkholderia acidisoli]